MWGKDLFFTRKNQAAYLSYLALMSAVCVVSRYLFAPLPNIQPITVIFLLVAVIFGPLSATIIMTITMVVTGLYMGFGIWVLFQCLVYACLLFLTYQLIKSLSSIPRILHAIWAAFIGFIYGILMDLCAALYFHISAPLLYMLNGTLFNCYHAVNNFFFWLVLVPVLIPQLKKARQKIER